MQCNGLCFFFFGESTCEILGAECTYTNMFMYLFFLMMSSQVGLPEGGSAAYVSACCQGLPWELRVGICTVPHVTKA